MSWIRFCLYWLLIFSTAPLAGGAVQPLILSPDQAMFSLNDHLEYVEDREGLLDIDALIAEEPDWQRPDREVLSFGFTPSTYWVRTQQRPMC